MSRRKEEEKEHKKTRNTGKQLDRSLQAVGRLDWCGPTIRRSISNLRGSRESMGCGRRRGEGKERIDREEGKRMK